MELEKFLKDSLIAIQKGIKNANVEGSEVRMPLSFKDSSPGVEFDLGIYYDGDEVNVIGSSDSVKAITRIKFFVPIVAK